MAAAASAVRRSPCVSDGIRPVADGLQNGAFALGAGPKPLNRCTPGLRDLPDTLPPIEYADGDLVRKVITEGWVSFKGYEFKAGRALRGHPVELRPTAQDSVWGVCFKRPVL